MTRSEKLSSISEALYTAETGLFSSNPYEVIPVASAKIFDFNYELFDEAYKSIFEQKIVKHYYTRRLCTTDFNKWKLWLDAKLSDILPYYNQLYKSATLELNPLYNFIIEVQHNDSGGDILESTTTNNKDTSTGTTTQNERNQSKSGEDVTDSEKSNKNVNKYNDTPQGRLEDIEDGSYLTEATIVDDNGTGKNTITYGSKNEDKFKEVITGKNVENENESKNEKLMTDRAYTEHVMGRKDASDADLLIKFRQTFLNIDLMVINELNDLFDGMFYPDDYE